MSSERDERVRQRAAKLWEDAGRSETGPQAYEGRANELISMEEAPDGLYQAYGDGEDMPPEIRKLAAELQTRLSARGPGGASD